MGKISLGVIVVFVKISVLLIITVVIFVSGFLQEVVKSRIVINGFIIYCFTFVLVESGNKSLDDFQVLEF